MNELAIALVTAGVFLLGAVALFVWPRNGNVKPTAKALAAASKGVAPAPTQATIIDLDAIDRRAREQAAETVVQRAVAAKAAAQADALVEAITKPVV